jgi:hypothetical protein
MARIDRPKVRQCSGETAEQIDTGLFSSFQFGWVLDPFQVFSSVGCWIRLAVTVGVQYKPRNRAACGWW